MKRGTHPVRARSAHLVPSSEESRAFVRGFAAAVAELSVTLDQPTMAKSLLDGAGLRLAHLWDANVDKPDLRVLEKLFKPARAASKKTLTRCPAIGPAPERFRCGLHRGHDGNHHAITPSGMPW